MIELLDFLLIENFRITKHKNKNVHTKKEHTMNTQKNKKFLARGISLVVATVFVAGLSLGQNLVVTGSGSFNNSGTIKVKGNINTAGATAAVTIPGTVELNGTTSAQDIGTSGGKDITFNTLNLLGTTNKQMSVNVSVVDALTVNNGAGQYLEVGSHTLTISGLSTLTSGTINTVAGSNVVFNGNSGNQTVLGLAYAGNLTLSGNAAKNLGGNVSVAGNFSHSDGSLTVDQDLALSTTGGSASFATIADITKTLTIGNGTTSIAAITNNHGTITAETNDAQINVSGNVTNSGLLVSGSGGVSVGGSLTNVSGAFVTMNDGALAVASSLQNEGTITFGSAASSLAAVTNQSAGNITGGSALVTFNGTFEGSGTSTATAGTGGFVFGNTVSLAGGTLTAGNDASIAMNNDFSMSSGTLSLTGTGLLTVNQGFSTTGGSVSFASTSTVSYTGSADQNVYSTTYGNLTIGGSGNKTAAGDITVSGNSLNLYNSFSIGSNTLTFNQPATTVSGSYDIVGKVRRSHAFSAGVAYSFNRPEVTMALASNAAADITLGMYPGTSPAAGLGTKYVNRQYTVSSSTDVTANNLTAQLYYTDSELQNSPAEGKLGFYKYNGSNWTKLGTNNGTYTRTVGSDPNTILLTNINEGLAGITEIGIRPLEYITIANGLWNAVTTWGTTLDDIPGATDDATVRHAVTGLGGSNQIIANLTVEDNATYNGAITIDANTFTATTITSTGAINVVSGASLVSGALQNNTVAGGASTVTVSGIASFSGVVANAGTFTVDGATGAVTASAGLSNAGTLTVNNAGGQLTVTGGDLTNSGTITNAGTITVE